MKTMRALAAILMLFLLGCATSAKKMPSRNDAATVPADDSGPEAANERRVKRYDDEQSVDHRPLVVQVAETHASDSYPKGETAFVLVRGQRVAQLGERNGFYRVTLTPPEGGPTLMGWVARFAFEEPSKADVSAASTPLCSGTSVAVASASSGPRCAYVCNAARECGDARRCEAAILLPLPPGISDERSYTTACAASAPSAPALVPSLFGAPHASNGACPSGFTAAKSLGSLCYRACQTDRDCPTNAACKMTKDARLCEVKGQEG